MTVRDRKSWLCAAVAAAAALSSAAQAQVDWGPMIQTEAMNSAIDDAARQGTTTARKPQPRARTGAEPSDAKARADCARVHGWIAQGKQHPTLSRALGLCRQLGY